MKAMKQRIAKFSPVASFRNLCIAGSVTAATSLPAFAGVILMEAVKQTFAMTLRPVHARVPAPRGGLLQPQAATRR